jgi:DNA polymerase III epsilon subunit-like protein
MIIVVDVETTGLHPDKNGIVSIGAVVYEDPTKTFYEECRVREDAYIDPKALVVNGFTKTEIRDENKFSEARLIEHFAEWWKSIGFEDNIIAGHNVHFDWGFLNEAFIRNNVALLINKRILDLHSLCMASLLRRGKLVGEIHSDFLMSYVGLPTEPKPHNALNGALWETEALSRLTIGKNKLPQFAQYSLPEYLTE